MSPRIDRRCAERGNVASVAARSLAPAPSSCLRSSPGSPATSACSTPDPQGRNGDRALVPPAHQYVTGVIAVAAATTLTLCSLCWSSSSSSRGPSRRGSSPHRRRARRVRRSAHQSAAITTCTSQRPSSRGSLGGRLRRRFMNGYRIASARRLRRRLEGHRQGQLGAALRSRPTNPVTFDMMATRADPLARGSCARGQIPGPRMPGTDPSSIVAGSITGLPGHEPQRTHIESEASRSSHVSKSLMPRRIRSLALAAALAGPAAR
jgi:hypothetical protein